MKKPSEPRDWEALRDKVIGLGEQSHKKSHYAQSRDRLVELERMVVALAAERDRSQLYLDTVPAIVVALDTRGRITMLNPFGCGLLGYGLGELLGQDWFATCLPQPEGKDTVLRYFEQLIRGEAEQQEYFENHLLTADGRRVLVAWHNALLRDEDGRIVGTLSAGEDITERRAAEEAAHSLAFYDPLTGLPNRRLLLDRLQHSMTASLRSGSYLALLFLDLDHFKTLNDTQGHDQGDRLLVETARRLQACVRDGDTVSRLGGDEFVLLLDQLSADVEEAAAQVDMIGEKIIARLGEPYELGKESYRGTTSVGITLFVGDALSVDDLLKRADLAMYQAKASGRNAMRFFDPAMQAAINARVALENDLRRAVAANEFVLYFQPQVDRAGTCVGVEALLRWNSPQRGFVEPGDFIRLAEETELIQPIGHWVMTEACEQLAEWRCYPATAHLSIAVNVSVRQFRLPTFVGKVRSLIAAFGIDPERLKLEITESVLLEDVEDVIAKMSALKSLGVTFSLDDFGTGYSSLAYVKRLPLDQIKIDQSFVRDIPADPNSTAVCRAIIGLGRSLGLHTIAEGVETPAQRAFLLAEGCDGVQGHLFAKAMPSGELLGWLGRRLSTAHGRVHRA